MTLDPADDDPVRLWTHLATAVERLGQGLGGQALFFAGRSTRRGGSRCRPSADPMRRASLTATSPVSGWSPRSTASKDGRRARGVHQAITSQASDSKRTRGSCRWHASGLRWREQESDASTRPSGRRCAASVRRSTRGSRWIRNTIPTRVPDLPRYVILQEGVATPYHAESRRHRQGGPSAGLESWTGHTLGRPRGSDSQKETQLVRRGGGRRGDGSRATTESVRRFAPMRRLLADVRLGGTTKSASNGRWNRSSGPAGRVAQTADTESVGGRHRRVQQGGEHRGSGYTE
jgi:hypothetical protein